MAVTYTTLYSAHSRLKNRFGCLIKTQFLLRKNKYYSLKVHENTQNSRSNFQEYPLKTMEDASRVPTHCQLSWLAASMLTVFKRNMYFIGQRRPLFADVFFKCTQVS